MAFRSIEIYGERLNIVEYSGPLWRADKEYFQPTITADRAFDRPIKYFALNERDTASYATRNPYIHQWRTRAPLILINMMDTDTRNALYRIIQTAGQTTKHINTAFPLNINRRVYRQSEEETQLNDDLFLNFICGLGLDGYYMERQEPRQNRRVLAFHSEVGLCAGAFHKLVLQNISRSREPPRMPNRRAKRNNVVRNKNSRRLNFNRPNNTTTKNRLSRKLLNFN